MALSEPLKADEFKTSLMKVQMRFSEKGKGDRVRVSYGVMQWNHGSLPCIAIDRFWLVCGWDNAIGVPRSTPLDSFAHGQWQVGRKVIYDTVSRLHHGEWSVLTIRKNR